MEERTMRKRFLSLLLVLACVLTLAAVPEPASASLGLLGLAALLMRRRRF